MFLDKSNYTVILLVFLLSIFLVLTFNFIFIILYKARSFENKIIKDIKNKASNNKIIKYIINLILNKYNYKTNEEKNYIMTYIIILIFLLLIIIYLLVTHFEFIKQIYIKFKIEIITYLMLLLIFVIPYYLYGIFYLSNFFI